MQTPCGFCVAPGNTRVLAMCRGRHWLEGRVGMRHIKYFADRIGAVVQMYSLASENTHWVEDRVGMRQVKYFADRIGTVVQMLLLSLGNPASVCPCGN